VGWGGGMDRVEDDIWGWDGYPAGPERSWGEVGRAGEEEHMDELASKNPGVVLIFIKGIL